MFVMVYCFILSFPYHLFAESEENEHQPERLPLITDEEVVLCIGSVKCSFNEFPLVLLYVEMFGICVTRNIQVNLLTEVWQPG